MTATVSVAPPAAQPGGQRLRASGDVRRVFAARTAVRRGPVTVHTLRRADDGAPRWTVVAGRAVGNAVVRNRVKRRLRAIMATAPLRPGVDYVVVGRADAATVPAAALQAAVTAALDQVAS